MPSPEKISGYQLAEHLLAEGGVEALIRHAGYAETDWLELKAGMCLLPEDKKKGETEKYLYWNIAKEVIALMNTSGGALVIGVHDKTLNLVPLENNDPRHMIAAKDQSLFPWASRVPNRRRHPSYERLPADIAIQVFLEIRSR